MNEETCQRCEINAKNGFEMALDLIYQVINGLDWTLTYTAQEIIELIEDEVDLYKKDG